MIVIDLKVLASVFIGLAIALPFLQKTKISKDKIEEVFFNLGVRKITPEEQNTLLLKFSKAGIKFNPEQFIGIKLLSTIVWLVLTLSIAVLNSKAFILVALFPLIYFIPDMWLNSRIKNRKMQTTANMPFFTRILSMILFSGASTTFALQFAAKATGGPIASEIEKVTLDFSVSESLPHALHNLTKRTDVPELILLAKTISDVYEGGAPMAETIKEFSEQMRITKRFETMEKTNGLVIKLIFPIFFLFLIPFILMVLYPAFHSLSQTL